MLNKPILFYDLETTNNDPETARIVQIGYELLDTDGEIMISNSLLVDPGVPIEPSATEVHGITDKDVTGLGFFSEIASEIREIFNRDVVIAGYNNRHFDDVVLEREMARAGYPGFSLADRPCLDVYSLVMRLRPRTLEGVVKEVLGERMKGAHDASADVTYTRHVAGKLIGDNSDKIPYKAEKLNGFLYPDFVDREGKLRFNDEGEAYFTFGKYGKKETTLREVVRTDPGYLEWMLGQDFPSDLKQILRDALSGEFPVAPTGQEIAD